MWGARASARGIGAGHSITQAVCEGLFNSKAYCGISDPYKENCFIFYRSHGKMNLVSV
jgi:hypothetical protein